MMKVCVQVAVVITALWVGAAVAQPVGTGTEFPKEQNAIIEATKDFFDTVEAKQTPRTRNRTFAMPLRATRSRASVGDAEVLTRMGPVRNLTGYQISWYPIDRLLGTVDFMGTWDGNRNLVCGYLTWDLTDPDAPLLHSIGANFVSLDELRNASDVQVHRILLKANCAFGAIDDNYNFFDVTG